MKKKLNIILKLQEEKSNELMIVEYPEEYVDPGVLTIIKGDEVYDFDTNTGKIEFYTKFNYRYPR